MDAKITKTRLEQMLSYDWIKIIAVALAAILVWSLVFTMSATRITATQQFVIMNYPGAWQGDKFSNYYKMQGKDFSYEIIEMSAEDLAANEGQLGTLLETRFAVGTGDVMFAPNVDDPDTKTEVKDEQGNVTDTTYTTYMAQFLNTSYFHYVARLDDADNKKGYFTQMKDYLARFYEITAETDKTYGNVTLTKATFGDLDESKVETAFKARVEKNKDKRFKTEEKLAQGVQDEIQRIQNYRAAYDTFFQNLDDGLIEFTVSTVTFGEYTDTGAYSLNVCPDENKASKLKDYVYYTVEQDSGTPLITAKDMNLLFLELTELDHDFKYENVIFVNKVVALATGA